MPKLINCKRCNKEKKNAGGGLCSNCYSYNRYHTDEKYRERHRKWMLEYTKRNKEKIYAYNREYVKRKYRDDPSFRERHRQYSLKRKLRIKKLIEQDNVWKQEKK